MWPGGFTTAGGAKKAAPAGISTTYQDDTEQLFPANFFAALNQGNDDEALRFMKAEALLPDGRTPSPRAESHFLSGEWDAKIKVPLVFVDVDACGGRVGDSANRACCVPRKACSIQAHRKSAHNFVPGWYISHGAKIGHVLTEPYLPSEDGPITSRGAGRLTDAENKFVLSVGKWKFIIDAWRASRVEVLSSVDPSPNFGEARSREEPSDPFAGLTGGLVSPEKKAAAKAAPFVEQDEDLYYARPFAGMFDGDEGEGEDPDKLAEEEEVGPGVDARNLEQLLDALQAMQHKFDERLRQAEAQVEAYRLQAKKAEERSTDLYGALQTMHARTQRLETRVSQTVPSGEEQAAQLDRLSFDFYNQQGAFMSLKSQFSDFRDKLESGGGIECNGVNFSSKREFLNWFEEKGPPVSLFLDSIAYLHSIRAAVVHQDDASKQREAQVKINMDSGLEASVMTSFDTILPSILVGGKKITEQGGGTFDWLQGYLKTYAVWKPRGRTTGVSHQILEGVGKVTKRVVELRGLKTNDSEVILLSSGLCTDSATFCKELVQFINEQHEELTADSAYSAEEIWAMQLECLQTIISELSEAREAVADAARHERGFYLWGMLRSWQIQQRYLTNHFKDDPALTGILVRRILMHGGDTTLKTKLGKIDELTRKVDEHHRNFQAELKKLQGAKKDNKA